MRSRPFLVLLAGCVLALAAAAQPMPLALPDGGRVAVAPDRAAGRYVLERRLADGRLDPAFGDAGVVPLPRDDEPPSTLRVDARGRIWLAGGGEGGSRAVVLRLSAQGKPDGSFGANGRSVMAPGGRDARAADLLPQDDGSAWVQGVVVDGNGEERLGLWRLRPDGGIDSRFGAGGLWIDPGAGTGDAAGLQQAPDGSVALGLRRATGADASLEVWAWRAGTEPHRVLATAVEARRLGGWQLAWRDGGWRWTDGAPPPLAAEAPVAPAAEPPREAPRDGGAAIATPFGGGDAAAAGRASESGAAWGWWLLLPAALAGVWWWRRGAARD